MSRVRSVDFLPEIFQTDTNKQFLSATLDQLIQEPRFRKTEGFIGRRVGPGVNPNDRYVVEPDAVRANYQLEPGVISLDPDNTNRIVDAITYPGINDAIRTQGGISNRPDLLYSSEYYCWDPFCDFDAFVNFNQYYWLPDGPDPVDVSATGISATDNFAVTRANGVYTFSGVAGNNPELQLLRGGSYTFSVTQNAKETVNYRVSNDAVAAWLIDNQPNPTLTLARGNTYVFNLNLREPYPFFIKSQPTLGTEDVYDQGVSRNGSVTGVITFVVPQDAPNTLYYTSPNQSNLLGTINIVDGTAGTGPGFWIQTNPGVDGRIPTSPNISSRDVFGVINNGEDLGTITFNVPQKTAQEFFYNLNQLPVPVDLITGLKYDQINNQPLSSFLAAYGGIDGISALEGRTLVFAETPLDTTAGGWFETTFFDPLQQTPANNGLPGSFDTTLFDQTTEVPFSDRQQLWQINILVSDGIQYIQLAKITDIPLLDKFSVRYGTVYSNTQWYKTSDGVLAQIPLLTATLDTLYYQDGTDPELFGVIRLIDETDQSTLFINDTVLGKPNYTSPNGVTFTNGLKVVFRGDVVPASFGSGLVDFVCTSTNDQNNSITTTSTAPLYQGQEIIFQSPTLGGLQAGQSYYVQTILNLFQFTVSATPGGLDVNLENGSGTMQAIGINYREFYVAGVGSAIELLPVINFVTPETYVEGIDDSGLAARPLQPDYITIDRASQDLNAWTRSNRWFHVDVINATGRYNNTLVQVDPAAKAFRPILQFRSDIRLYNMGTQGKQPIDIIDFEVTDAFSTIQGSTSYSVDGYTFVNGTRVIFAADQDFQVRNKIYTVEFVVPDTVPPLIAQPIINLVLASDGDVLPSQATVVLEGQTSRGKTYWYDGTAWILAQQKTNVQQAPLFDIYDSTGVSYGDQTKYPSSDFLGSKLFSYAIGDGLPDAVLKFPLQYLNIENIGDIVFDNNLYTDTFVYTRDNVSTTQLISDGTAREYISRNEFRRLLGWQDAITTSQIYQQFQFTYDGQDLELDVAVSPEQSVPSVKIYVGSKFRDPGTYSYEVNADNTVISLDATFAIGDRVEVLALSSQTSKIGFYQVPINLENNPFNSNSPSFTLGTIRQHYQSLCENLLTVTGNIIGANNTRDLGNLVPYGLTILQQSAPLTLAGYFLRSEGYNIFASLRYNALEYTKYKNLLLDRVTELQVSYQTPADLLDQAMESLSFERTDDQPFYWSDMLPNGAIYTQTDYVVSFTTSNVFDTQQVYDYTSANYLGMDVYLNDVILLRGRDYEVATDGPRITILLPLSIGDSIVLREYANTAGSFVPNTPTKIGAYPAWEPRIVDQVTSNGTKPAIIGHDGSLTALFQDVRDEVLLEFERRIYNNLKLDGNPLPISVTDVLPGQFRDTGFSDDDVNSILQQDFLLYVADNKLDYRTQQYNANNEFSYNYSRSTNKLDNQPLLGAWRGIYRYFYDTQQPSLTPWEMLGFSIKPLWWDETYGEAPYTDGNLVLWDDLALGLVRDPAGTYIRPEYARPNLQSVIPVGSEGELLPPLQCVVAQFENNQFRRSWSPYDGSPVEATWWNSSYYPFAVMRLLALTRPAKFFALLVDRDLYRYQADFDQYLYNDRYRLDANGIEIYGNGISKASYINWIVDYNRQSGLQNTTQLSQNLQNLDVRLCYRMASWSDKQYIKIFTEKVTPQSTNTSFLIPDSGYDLVLYKNQAFATVSYSAVLVQRVAGGFAVFGYSTVEPFFRIQQSQTSGRLRTISVVGTTVRVPDFYTNQVESIPYGFVFANATAVADFLLSYGQYLERQGLTFDDVGNGYQLDWNQMVNEFLYWNTQGWDENAVICLNPLASRLEVTRPGAVVDNIQTQTIENLLLDQNRKELPTRNLNIVRLDNTFSVTPLVDQSLSSVELRFTSYEHMIVMANRSEFGDLIYDPVTGARQDRLSLTAFNTSDWNGTLDAQGFILNQDNVQEWTGLRTYAKGEIVFYKGSYWSAATIVQPSVRFNTSDWLQSDYQQIEQGLLPNLANKASQLTNSYNINSANLETDNDLFSYGLIGFRPRQYLAALNLDDVSQVNVYRQFLGTKGTLRSTNNLLNANLGKEAADYEVFENWAIQRAVYGANANRSFFELRLNSSLLTSNPSIIQIVLPQQGSQADQAILLSNLWRQSFVLSSPDILPTTRDLPTDTALPSAGYVSLDDVDITIFDIRDPDILAANINSITVGTTIWVAKINRYDWNIYRAQAVPGYISHVCDNLDQTSLVIFTAQHGLAAGDRLIIRFFDTEVDGVYEVIRVPSLDSVTIAFSFTGDRTVVNGVGLGFTLVTMRVPQFADVVNLPYANQLIAGAKIWVDDDGTGHWAVLQKNDVFSALTTLSPKVLDATEGFGASVAQSNNRFAALVGSPRYGFGTGVQSGAVYVYTKSFGETYQPISPVDGGDAVLTLTVSGVRNYGFSVDFGDQDWAVAGAPGSLGSSAQTDNGYACVIFRDTTAYLPGTNPYFNWQLLTTPGSVSLDQGKFGYAVAISDDERWMYIGAPAVNAVYAYGRVDWQDQTLRTLASGSETQYIIYDEIQIDQATQLRVSLDGRIQVLNQDYVIDATFGSVTFAAAPVAGTLIEISRIALQPLDAETYYDVAATGGTGSNAVFVVTRRRGTVAVAVQSGGTGYTATNLLTISGASVGAVNPITFTVVTVGLDGAILSISSPSYTPPALATTFDLGQYFFQVSLAYSTINSFSIEVDGSLQRPDIDYTFNASTKQITFLTVPGLGTNILARAKGYWLYASTLTVPGLASDAGFGSSVSCTSDGRQVMIAAPTRDVDGLNEAGTVYVFDRDVQSFIYGQDPSSVTFTVLGTPVAPVSVTVNNMFLINQDCAVINAPNSFAVAGNLITVNTDLQLGDTVEIQTNQFTLLQTLTQHDPETESRFGQSVAICPADCSLYMGAPRSSLQVFKGGVVERWVNQARLYGTIASTVVSSVLTAGHTLRVNDQNVAVPSSPNNTLTALAAAITAEVPNVSATVTGGIMTLSVSNTASTLPDNKLQVLPGTIGNLFETLGFECYSFAQTIKNPYPKAYAAFGTSMSVGEDSAELVIGTPQGNMYLPVIFDNDLTEFDAGSTIFFSEIQESGVVYVFDFAAPAVSSVSNPGNFVLGQQITIPDVYYLDQLGTSLSYRSGALWMGAPGSDLGDSSTSGYGEIYVWQNATRSSAWQPLQVQQSSVDVRLLNSVFLYNLNTAATTEFLDFFDPLQGKILGAARQNIDYIGAIDPASYNSGPFRITGNTWGEHQVGQIWWDISTVRFIDPLQDSITYTARRWGQTFPGSAVDVYQWTISDVAPANYAGPGTPFNLVSYTINSVLSDDGTFSTQYFFWVRGLDTVARNKGKTLSVTAVAQYIENPRGTGIAYLAPLNASTVAIYNCETLLEAQDTVLHIEFDRELTTDNVHVEYELIPQDRADGFLSDNLYRKFQDSLCGVDTFGNLVPDPNLSPAEKYGVQFRPRQSMFVDRFEALRNYIDRTNDVLVRYPIAETRIFNLLNSEEPQPGPDSGLWNMRVPTLEILGFQDIYAVPLNYRYLVESDVSQRGLWTIYSVVPGTVPGERILLLFRVQNFYTPDYWSYVDWYLPGYNSSQKPVASVPNFSALATITVPVGASVKVDANSLGKFEIFVRTDTGWDRVGLQDGTIQISSELYDYAQGRFGFDVEVFDAQYFDQEPVIETRQIIRAINEELFIDELLIERNRLLVLMFNYALTEQGAPGWITKTSLIDVDHRIRELLPFEIFTRDNQEFVVDYLQEVKPYHVQIREFNLTYFGQNLFLGDINDFDLPAYFNTDLVVPQFTSPILLPYAQATNQIFNNLSDQPASSSIWQTWPYSEWFANYTLIIDFIQVTDGGSGYTNAPQVVITGDASVASTASAVINSAGQVIAVNVLTRGTGYLTTPTVSFFGGNGSGAEAYVRLIGQGLAFNYNTDTPSTLSTRYDLARLIRTRIKYDRYQYNTQIQTWSPEGTYVNGTLVRYDNRAWRADNSDGSSANVGPDFNLEDWDLVPAGQLSGVDRTMGYYVPSANLPGLSLPLLITGVEYPGVQVWGNYFLGTEPLDTVYSSEFTDQFLGLEPTSINIDGGEFIGPYEAHAPEELVNGSEFDTLDIRVFTRPGSDWQDDGHGFQTGSTNVVYNQTVTPDLSWAGLVDRPATILVSNVDTGESLTENLDYIVNWLEQTVTPVPGVGVSDGDTVAITAYELGGGSQLYRSSFAGSSVISAEFLVPVSAAEIQNIAIFVNGELWLPVVTWQAYIDSAAWSIFNAYPINSVVNNAGIYYRAIQVVPIGIAINDSDYWLAFTPTLLSLVDMQIQPASNDYIDVVVFGQSTVQAGNFIIGRSYTITVPGNTNFIAIGASDNEVGTTFTATGQGSGFGLASTFYSWSTPVVQTEIADVTIVTNFGFTLTNSLQGTNPVNCVINLNGKRLTPPAGIEWIGDGTSTSFGLPQRLGASFLQSSINAITDIQVWVDDVLQTQAFGANPGDYSVTPWTGSNTPGRQVLFASPPPDGADILITVDTLTDYDIVSNQLQLKTQPNLGDVIQVITWNDTSQQEIATLCFFGPVVTGLTIEEPYDSTNFDPPGSVNFGPGSFDFSAGGSFNINNFDLGRSNVIASRLWVTLDGVRLYEGRDFTMSGSFLILSSGTILSNQVLAVTMFTDSLVPEASAFRIFQDMRGVQATYRITENTTTSLAQPLSTTDTVITVTNARALAQPDLPSGIFGIITIDGERITYREIDLINNTLSGLRRGTAGTAVDSHAAGTPVYDIGAGNLLSPTYQDYLVGNTAMGDGSTTVFYAPAITITSTDESSTELISIEVFVGGIRQDAWSDPDATSEYRYIITDFGQDTPVTVEFVVDFDPETPRPAPAEGSEVAILQRRGTWWYDVNTPDLALQETDTIPARFLTDR